MNFQQFWSVCMDRLQKILTPYQYQVWLSRLNIAENDNSWVIYAPTDFIKNLVKDNCLINIKEMKEDLIPDAPEIELQVKKVNKDIKPNFFNNTNNSTLNYETRIINGNNNQAVNNIKNDNKLNNNLLNTTNSIGYEHTRLKSDFTFQNLVIGKGNQLANSAGLAISEQLGRKDYNPFFIYGSTGLGKTHLAQAIANKVLKTDPDTKIRYTHAEKFINDYINSVRRRNWDEFKKHYNTLDLLILDDVQFIAGKEKTMEEFFYIFNNFLDKDKQIILTSDRLPQKIDKLDNRLKSRFACGLTVEIEPPEFEMRVAILHKKAEAVNFRLPEDTVFFIAQSIESNVRDLEGALNRVRAHCRFTNKSPDIDLVKQVLKDILSTGYNQISLEKIQKTVADFYNISLAEIRGKKRLRKIARPRQIAMSLSKDLTKCSLPSIGDAFGGKDHTTVLHAYKTISKLRTEDEKISQDYDTLTNILKN